MESHGWRKPQRGFFLKHNGPNRKNVMSLMATTKSPTIEKKQRSWPRRALGIAAWVAGVPAVVMVVAYFVVTSSTFIKGIILPRVSAVIHADVTVTDVSFHPFSKITVRGLKVQAKGQEPVVTATEVSARYSLWSILGGNFRVYEVALISPTVALVESPEGSSNLDALKSAAKAPTKPGPPSPARPSPPPQIDFRKLTLSNATIRKIKNYPGGRRDFLELANINVALTNVKNGQSAKLQLDAALRLDSNPSSGTNGLVEATIKGGFDFTLTADLKPAVVTGGARLEVSRADGRFSDFSGFGGALDCDVTPVEIKQAVLHFQRGGMPLGELAVSGPLDMEKMEGRLKVELRGIDKQLLNLAGAASRIDFGTTTISSSNEIELIKSGSIISATGRFDAGQVQLTRAGQTTPTFDFGASYDVTMDCAAQNMMLRSLILTGTQNGNPLLSAHLSRPMNLVWGNVANEMGDSALDLAVSGLNLADWKPFLGNTAAGKAGLTLKLSSQQGGKLLGFALDSQINNLAAPLGSNQTFQATVSLLARGQAADLKKINLSEYRFQVAQQNQPLLTVSGSGVYDFTDASADLLVAVQGSLAGMGRAMPRPELNISSGTIELKGQVTQKSNTQTVAGNLVLANLTGQAGKNQFQDYGSAMDLDVSRTAEQVKINKLAGKLTSGGKAGGAFDLAGTCNLASKSAQLTVNLSDFNQNSLRPFLEPLLADKKLVSIAVNGSAIVQNDSKDSCAIKASLQVTNLVVSDPKQQIPATPLEAKLQIDTTVQKQSASIRQFQITLTPTKRGQNQVQLQGQVDFSQASAIQGNLKLSADSLDVTGYYDLFAGAPKGGGMQPAAASPSGPASTAASQEPPAMNLPVKNFTVAADIGKFYLREVEITRMQTTVKADGGHVTIKPFQLTLNGSPVNASVDLTLDVPGYKYDLDFGADRVPVAPLVNTFAPDRKGQLGGTFTAQAKFAGAGVTGASLQKNLAGQFTVGATNLNLSVMNVHSAILKTLINVIATIPQLLSSPESAIASLLGQVTGQGGGLTDTLRQSPIQIINAQGKADGGRIDLTSASVQSTAFEADARGGIALAQVLTNSTISIPVTVFVSQPIGKQLNLASASTAASANYVSLPQFLTMTGTIGNPKADINKAALAGLALKSVGQSLLNQPQNAGSKVGNLLNNFLNRPAK
jgi:uncharacterized protein involved in outer membrane biogenesis